MMPFQTTKDEMMRYLRQERKAYVGEDAVKEMQLILDVIVEKVTQEAFSFAKHAGRVTVGQDDMRMAARTVGVSKIAYTG